MKSQKQISKENITRKQCSWPRPSRRKKFFTLNHHLMDLSAT